MLFGTDFVPVSVARILSRKFSDWLLFRLFVEADGYTLTFFLVDAHRGDANQLGTLALACLLVHSEK